MDLTHTLIKRLWPNWHVGWFWYDLDLYMTLTDKWIPLHKQIKKSQVMPLPCVDSCLGYGYDILFSHNFRLWSRLWWCCCSWRSWWHEICSILYKVSNFQRTYCKNFIKIDLIKIFLFLFHIETKSNSVTKVIFWVIVVF